MSNVALSTRDLPDDYVRGDEVNALVDAATSNKLPPKIVTAATHWIEARKLRPSWLGSDQAKDQEFLNRTEELELDAYKALLAFGRGETAALDEVVDKVWDCIRHYRLASGAGS